MIITIDGPAASGKSTTARLVADELNLYYINSGLLFRTIAYYLIHTYDYTPQTIANARDEQVATFLLPGRCIYHYDKTGVHILLNGIEITSLLKSSSLDIASSIIATHTAARRTILSFQQTLAQNQPSIIEGRDCGSVVFPHAHIKFYLTARLEIRAQRWQHMQAERGNNVSLEESMRSISERDQRDMQRTLDPLVIPSEAYIIDNSAMTQAQTIDSFIKIINSHR